MKVCWIAVLGVAAVLLASCGGEAGSDVTTAASTQAAKKPPVAAKQIEQPPNLRHLELSLAGWEGPESLGIMMAESRDYFGEAGLDVDVLTPVTPVNTVKYVVEGLVEFGVAPAPQVAMARSKGLPIVAVGSLVRRPTATMIWLRGSGIRGIGDLKGKTIAIPGLSYQRAFLANLLERAGLSLEDVEVKAVGYELVPALVSGRADAVFGGSSNIEGLELKSRGLRPVAVRAGDLGFPGYEQAVVIARTRQVAREPELVRGFMSAVRRGTVAAIKNPEAAVTAVEKADEPNREASLEDNEAEVAATLPLLDEDGRMSPDQARLLVAWMYEQGMIQRQPPVSSLLTNGYLAKPSQR